MVTNKEFFGSMPDGRQVYLFTLENSNGVKVQVTNYGARIVSAFAPDRNGKFENVVLGYGSLDHYLKGHPYLGATIGRVANRIGNASFEMDGLTYHLTKNHGENHLHGGFVGFESLYWDIIEDNNQGKKQHIEFQTTSPDKDQGHPGNLDVKVRYSLHDDNSLKIDLIAETDRSTIVNMTNHAYFRLNGNSSENIYNHKVKLFCSNYLETDNNLIPTGKLVQVKNTPLDFIKPKVIGLEINKPIEPLLITKGYDHFFVLDNYQRGVLNLMANVEEPESGRVLQVYSTLPGLQFYTSNFLDTEYPNQNGCIYGNHSSFCLEPSYFIDAPNHPSFHSIKLNKEETYCETIVYQFLIK